MHFNKRDLAHDGGAPNSPAAVLCWCLATNWKKSAIPYQGPSLLLLWPRPATNCRSVARAAFGRVLRVSPEDVPINRFTHIYLFFSKCKWQHAKKWGQKSEETSNWANLWAYHSSLSSCMEMYVSLYNTKVAADFLKVRDIYKKFIRNYLNNHINVD